MQSDCRKDTIIVLGEIKQLCASFSYYRISYQNLIQYFYEELIPGDRRTIDVTVGGARINKTPIEAQTPISTMVENSQ